MLLVLLIFIPVLGGIFSFFLKNNAAVKGVSLLFSLATFALSLCLLFCQAPANYQAEWLPQMGSSFSLSADGMAKMLCFLTALTLPLIFTSTVANNYKSAGAFYGLTLLMQAGLMGVFLASDVLLFYFFWELALIPAYFLCSNWGGERRIQASFKFFVYTFAGSLLLLVGILYLYNKTPEHSFALQSFYNLKLSAKEQGIGFWLFFIAFAIKMPMFPLHTWQPEIYEQSPTAITMILSGIMAKMGLYAVVRWLFPLFPDATAHFSQLIIILSVIGVLYASFIAIKEDDMKRLVAYSSIAHIGLMCAAIFSHTEYGLQGALLQVFNHGINVIGLWIVVNAIEQKTGTRKLSELGGLAQKAPALAILFCVMALANVALPLTNSFVGEFLMFMGLFKYNVLIAAFAGISIILVAVYTLWMMQKIFYGTPSAKTELATKSSASINFSLIIIAILVIAGGVYPQPMLDLVKSTVNAVLSVK
ncbi:MAG: NADH-quinone oxidoreductase subunit M [Chitinophagaceae bacterium]|jgi:NADH-quinone oxidoreductase subunit M|nr:NADH-quinone oxidoreductase subunit M [Chitinophagaceae bacterium]